MRGEKRKTLSEKPKVMPKTCLPSPTSRLMPRWSPGYDHLPCSLHSLFTADHGTAQPRVPLWSVGVCCPGCPHSQPLALPTEQVGRVRNRGSLDAVQTQTLACYHHCFVLSTLFWSKIENMAPYWLLLQKLT